MSTTPKLCVLLSADERGALLWALAAGRALLQDPDLAHLAAERRVSRTQLDALTTRVAQLPVASDGASATALVPAPTGCSAARFPLIV
jgi:hypothetical protein